MNMKALLGAFLALVLAVGGAAFLVANFVKPAPLPPPPVPAAVNDQLQVNPFDLTAPGPRPKVVVEATHFDFGVMALGTNQSHDYVFKNEGEGPLRLAKGKVLCKCTIPSVPDQEIQPGESVKIQLTWKPEDPSSDFSKEAVIWTNDPEKPQILLTLKGMVYEDPVAYPGQFALGDIPWDKANESEIHVMSSTSTDLQILHMEVSHPEWMTVTTAPADVQQIIQEGATQPEPKSGFALKLKITPNNTVGPFSGWIKLKTNLKEDIKTIDVVGVRTGPISIHGEHYQAAQSIVDMKRFKSAEGKVTRLHVSLEPFGSELQITEVISASKHLTATLQKVPTAADARKVRHVLLIQAVKGIAPGTLFTLTDPDRLTLKTNHPQVPEIHLKVSYIVN